MYKTVTLILFCFPLIGMQPLREIKIESASGTFERYPIANLDTISEEAQSVSPCPSRRPSISEVNNADIEKWVILELIQQNKEVYAKLKNTRKKWYAGMIGCLTSLVPLAVVTVELYSKATCEETE